MFFLLSLVFLTPLIVTIIPGREELEAKQSVLHEDFCSRGTKGTEWCGQVFSIELKCPNSVQEKYLKVLKIH